MKIKDLQTAMRLATITKRPLEDFYDGPTESQNIEQVQEELVETDEETSSEEIESDVQEIQDDAILPLRTVFTKEQYELAAKYNGKLSDQGKIICNKIDMSRKEYLALTKTMTEKDVLNSPLMYVMFRSEGQTEGHFWNWLSGFSI